MLASGRFQQVSSIKMIAVSHIPRRQHCTSNKIKFALWLPLYRIEQIKHMAKTTWSLFVIWGVQPSVIKKDLETPNSVR